MKKWINTEEFRPRGTQRVMAIYLPNTIVCGYFYEGCFVVEIPDGVMYLSRLPEFWKDRPIIPKDLNRRKK